MPTPARSARRLPEQLDAVVPVDLDDAGHVGTGWPRALLGEPGEEPLEAGGNRQDPMLARGVAYVAVAVLAAAGEEGAQQD